MGASRLQPDTQHVWHSDHSHFQGLPCKSEPESDLVTHITVAPKHKTKSTNFVK